MNSQSEHHRGSGHEATLTSEQLAKALHHLSTIAHHEQVSSTVAVRVPTPIESRSESKTSWLVRIVIPILASSLLSAGMTGIGTVSSIRQDLAVEHASVQLEMGDHERRLSKLEHDLVPRAEHEAQDHAWEATLKELQDQSRQTSADIEEIRQMLFRTQLKALPEGHAR